MSLERILNSKHVLWRRILLAKRRENLQLLRPQAIEFWIFACGLHARLLLPPAVEHGCTALEHDVVGIVVAWEIAELVLVTHE